MRLFIFKSEANPELRAFSADAQSSNLPSQFAPWHAVGVVRDDLDPPHNLDRAKIEQGIQASGFQLWRMRAAKKK